MFLKRIINKLFSTWPAEVPRLYPDVNDLQLAQFLSEAEYERIKSFDNVYVLPFISEESDPEQSRFGMGLSRLMIRNLMLLNDVSIHGPEDTPMIAIESMEELVAENPRKKSTYVTGIANFGSRGYVLNLEVHRPDRTPVKSSVQHADFHEFLRACSQTIAREIGSNSQTTVADAWTTGQPKDVQSLQRCGELCLDYNPYDPAESLAMSSAALQAMKEDPDFVVPMWNTDDETPGIRDIFFRALQRDPNNAQLCFSTFCRVWHSRGPQPEAMQFTRKAIELSPGHGKAHMCAPHTAHPEANMLWHSELGYRLLPGNPFAVNNFTIYLREHAAPPQKLIDLAEEGIAYDPCDAGNYYQLIDFYTELRNDQAALEVAERLQEFFEPEMNERTLYCLKQNPERARMIETGEFDPVAENRKVIAQLREKITRANR